MRSILFAIPALVMASQASAQAAYTVYFAFDSSRIDEAGIAAIDSAVNAYNTEGSASVSIVGHTDTVGSREYNMALSQRRAEAVAAALADRGVPSDAMTLAWRGFDEPAVATGPNVREARNRRAEIVLGGAAAPVEPPAPVAAPARLFLGVGPWLAWNADAPDDDGFAAGANLTAMYFVTDNVSVSAENAVFYNWGGDGGIGDRLVAGAEYHFGGLTGSIAGGDPYLGVNGGYAWFDGDSTGGWLVGPELGARFGNIDVKFAYDFVEDRDADDGIYAVSVGYLFPISGF